MKVAVHCAHDKIVAIGQLKPNPANPNRHPPEQIALLAKVIAAQGWRNPIVVSNRSGLITKGHARLEVAQRLKLKTAPVDFQDYGSEQEELADMIADNRIAELAEADRTMLRELAEQLDDGAFDMDLTGFDKDALEELMTAAPPDEETAKQTLAERFGVPPFSVLDARQGYWQKRKAAWMALGIMSELGRGGGLTMSAPQVTTQNLNYYRNRQ